MNFWITASYADDALIRVTPIQLKVAMIADLHPDAPEIHPVTPVQFACLARSLLTVR